MENLKPCPFCANSSTEPHDLRRLHIVESEGKVWGQPANRFYYVSCGRCFARAGSGVTGYNALTGTETSDDRARQIAIEKWNTRAATD